IGKGDTALGIRSLFANRIDPKSRQLVWQAAALKFLGDEIRAVTDRRIDKEILQESGCRMALEGLHADTLCKQPGAGHHGKQITDWLDARSPQQPLERIPGIVRRTLRQ